MFGTEVCLPSINILLLFWALSSWSSEHFIYSIIHFYKLGKFTKSNENNYQHPQYLQCKQGSRENIYSSIYNCKPKTFLTFPGPNNKKKLRSPAPLPHSLPWFPQVNGKTFEKRLQTTFSRMQLQSFMQRQMMCVSADK